VEIIRIWDQHSSDASDRSFGAPSATTLSTIWSSNPCKERKKERKLGKKKLKQQQQTITIWNDVCVALHLAMIWVDFVSMQHLEQILLLKICFKYFVNSPLDRIQNLVGFSNNSLGFYLFKQLGLQWCNFCFFITKIKALLAEEFIKQRKVHMRNCKSCIYIITLGY
jgi:hypothetical protein